MVRRLPVFVFFPILLVLILAGLWSCVDTASWSTGPSVLRDVFSAAFPPQQLGVRIEDMTRAEFVNASAPFASFRHSLVPGVGYITVGLGAGLANQIIAVMNLLLVSRFSNRIPILPDFTRDYGHIPPSDMEKQQTQHNLPVSELFDMERYKKDTDFPTLVWGDLKIPGVKTERASCWESHDESDRIVPASLLTYNQATEGDIEVDIWSSPSSILDIHRIKDLVAFLGDWPLRKAHAEDLLERWGKAEIGVQTQDGWKPKMQEEQFVCWSELYYFYTDRFDERWETSWEAWRTVGRHLHFAKPLLEIVNRYRGLVLGDASEQYIAVHARHGDFGRGTPASTYLPHVQTLQARHPELKKVLVFSDETEDSWWEGVAEQGWSRVDHDGMATSAELGAWYPTLIDMVLLSESSAFIGTQASTFSLLAKLRVQEWGGGDTILV